MATGKQTLCEKCRSNKDHSDSFKEITQKIVCECCGKVLKTVIKKVSGRTKEILAKGVCNECKEKHKIEASEKMKVNNPMFNPDIAKNLIYLEWKTSYIHAKRKK